MVLSLPLLVCRQLSQVDFESFNLPQMTEDEFEEFIPFLACNHKQCELVDP